MTDLSTLTDTALNECIARLLGWKICGQPFAGVTSGICEELVTQHGIHGQRLPAFATSLDALKSGPEKMLREAGWEIEISERANWFTVWWWRSGEGRKGPIKGEALTDERARAEAVNEPERGDTVRHRPSGEEWLLIRVEGDYVYPGGWPISRALKADCVVVKKADAEAIAFLDQHAPLEAGK